MPMLCKLDALSVNQARVSGRQDIRFAAGTAMTVATKMRADDAGHIVQTLAGSFRVDQSGGISLFLSRPIPIGAFTL
jgi:hypothetical protein